MGITTLDNHKSWHQQQHTTRLTGARTVTSTATISTTGTRPLRIPCTPPAMVSPTPTHTRRRGLARTALCSSKISISSTCSHTSTASVFQSVLFTPRVVVPMVTTRPPTQWTTSVWPTSSRQARSAPSAYDSRPSVASLALTTALVTRVASLSSAGLTRATGTWSPTTPPFSSFATQRSSLTSSTPRSVTPPPT